MFFVDIQKYEKKLEKEINELQKFLKCEERINEFEMILYGYQNRERDFKEYMQKLENEKQEFINKLNNVIKEKKMGEYKFLQIMLERNKLQIYVMEC